jgi:hypothetical protein
MAYLLAKVSVWRYLSVDDVKISHGSNGSIYSR